ncbi:unnamed protein product [Ambrosiozyma monospora]|uniref:Unnamed protein product n=1 Tax=Ambrosiozyma monospora TaxID=43982 RepID=A0A9W7DJQ7_AMBMO|nr:unnamed protein product [Ambrosiozyma monospora]
MAPVKYPEEFAGFAVLDTAEWNKPKYINFKPKQFGENDIDIEIECCGLCGSDIMTAKGGEHGWGQITLPQIVGHEIIGKVVKIGSKVTLHKLGDRVGLGAQAFCCLQCNRCKSHNEQYCAKGVTTYDGVYEDGYVSQGGYASHVRAHEYMCFSIPEEIKSTEAASLCCAGLTVYSPLVRYIPKLANGEVPKVAILGLGGLGHLAVQITKALGADAYVFSRTDSKKDQALKLGAKGFIATGSKDWEKAHYDQFDVILNCAIGLSGLNIDAFLSILKVQGRFVSVGLPSVEEKYDVSPFTFFSNGASLCSSALGSREEAIDLFNLAVKHNIRPWIEEIPISEEGCNVALTRAWNGDVRYRFVFTEFNKAFGTGKA